MAKSELGKSEKTILEILNDLGGTVNKTESSYPTQIITRELEIRQKLYLKGQLGGVFKSLSDKGYIRLTRINPNGRFVKIQVIKQPESEMEFTSLPEPNSEPAHSQPIKDQFFIAEAKYWRAVVDELIKRDLHLFISIVKEIG